MRSSELLTFHHASSGRVLVPSNIRSMVTLNQFSILTICHIYWLFHLDCDKYSILFSCRIGTVNQSTKLVLKVGGLTKSVLQKVESGKNNRNSSHDLLHSSGKLLFIGYVLLLGENYPFLKIGKTINFTHPHAHSFFCKDSLIHQFSRYD